MRRGSEFSERVKENARNSYYQDHPDCTEPLVIHHKIPIKIGRKLGIPRHILKSQENAQALPEPDHIELHKNEPTLEEYAILAQSLLGLKQIKLW